MADHGARRCEVTSAPAGRPAQGRRAPAAGLVLLALVGVLAVVGAGLAVRTVLASRSNPAKSVAGTTARTSWGTMEVHQSEVVSGLSDRALGGMSHGVQNLVSAGKAQVAVTVTLHNSSDQTVKYDASQFSLRAGHRSPSSAQIPPLSTSLSAGDLREGGTVEGTVSFVTVVDGSQLWLQLSDRGKNILVPVGTATPPRSSADEGGPHEPAPEDPGHEH